MKIYKIDRFLLGLLAAALVFRIPAIVDGLPATYNSTEYFLAKMALSMGANQSFDPGIYIYPTLYTYLLLLLYAGYYLIGNSFGFFPDVYTFATQFLIDPSGFYLISRIFNVSLFLVLLIILYLFLCRYTGKQIARFAVVMMLLSSYLLRYSCYGTADTLLVFFSALTIIYFYILFEQPTNKNLLLAGVFSGLAIASKYNAGFLVFGLIMAIILLVWRKKVRVIPAFGFSIGGALIGFLIPNPYWLISPQKFWHGFRLVAAQMYSAVSVESGDPYIWEIVNLIRDEYAVGVLFLIATIYYFLSGERKHLPAVVVILLTYLYVGTWTKKGIDYLFPAYPAWIILSSFLLARIMDKYRFNNKYSNLLPLLIFFPSLIGVSHQFITYSSQDTREQTTEWIIANVQKNEIICYDNSYIDLGVFDINRYLYYGAGIEKLPEPVKNKLMKYTNHPRQINFTPVLIPNLSRTLKTDNPYENEAVKYRRRNLSELINLGTDYLLTNVRYYDTFLMTNLKSHPPGVQIGIREVRQFYDQLFQYFDPIKTFTPTFWRPGPEIRIYDLHQKRRTKE